MRAVHVRREQGQMLSRHEGKALHGSSRHLSQAGLGSASHQAVEGNHCRRRRGVYILSGCGRWEMICVSGWCRWLWGRMPRPVSEFAKSRIYQRSPTHTTQQLRSGHPGLISSLIPRKIQLNHAPFWSAQQIHCKFLFLSSEQLEQWDHKPNMMDSNVIKPCKGVILYPPLNFSSWTEWEKHLRYTRHPAPLLVPLPPPGSEWWDGKSWLAGHYSSVHTRTYTTQPINTY